MVTVDNYFDATTGIFQNVPDEEVRRIWSAYRKWRKTERRTGTTVIHVPTGGDLYVLRESYKKFFVPGFGSGRSVSVYLTNEAHTELWRISDHWCATYEERNKRGTPHRFKLGTIASCRWYLADATQYLSLPVPNHGERRMGAGKINFSDLTQLIKDYDHDH